MLLAEQHFAATSDLTMSQSLAGQRGKVTRSATAPGSTGKACDAQRPEAKVLA
ncbi:MAG: hypothetical protein JNM43_07845 [Planctomycetaceae bacterium]|nr:hypothetical protein [Planctomycetaceae bacterium]